jgi:uncharacterized protein YqgV (UPF0045/DUF77 family)
LLLAFSVTPLAAGHHVRDIVVATVRPPADGEPAPCSALVEGEWDDIMRELRQAVTAASKRAAVVRIEARVAVDTGDQQAPRPATPDDVERQPPRLKPA